MKRHRGKQGRNADKLGDFGLRFDTEGMDPMKLGLLEYVRQKSKYFWRVARDSHDEAGRGVMFFRWAAGDSELEAEITEDGIFSMYVPLAALDGIPLPPELVAVLVTHGRRYKPGRSFLLCADGSDGITVMEVGRDDHKRKPPLVDSRKGKA